MRKGCSNISIVCFFITASAKAYHQLICDTIITTDANGKGTITFTPKQGGAYKIYASAKDLRGNLIKSSTFIWIAGPGYVPWRAPNSNRIDFDTWIDPKKMTEPGD